MIDIIYIWAPEAWHIESNKENSEMMVILITKYHGNMFVFSALVWGASVKHQPQKVGKEHELVDEDVVQVVKKWVNWLSKCFEAGYKMIPVYLLVCSMGEHANSISFFVHFYLRETVKELIFICSIVRKVVQSGHFEL